MALRIETFDNARGGNTLYKALTHPAAARSGRALIGKLARHAPIAIYDAGGALEAFSAFYDLDQIEIDGVYYLCNANYPGVNITLSVVL